MARRYYLINVAEGDDNDQSWTDHIIACEDNGPIHDALIALFESAWVGGEEDLAAVDINTDAETVYCLWYECDIPMHCDYHIEGMYVDLSDAVENVARYHAKGCVYDYDDSTGELVWTHDLQLHREALLAS